MFTQDVVDKMDKGQISAALKLANLLDAGTMARLNARKDVLNAPPAKTPFPKQAELNAQYDAMREAQENIKALIKEARDGNHTYVYEMQVKGQRQQRKPRGEGKAATTKRQVMQIIVGDKTYNSWREVADAHCPRIDLPRDKTNWRKIVQRAADVAGTVTFTDDESLAYYNENFPANGWTYKMAEAA